MSKSNLKIAQEKYKSGSAETKAALEEIFGKEALETVEYNHIDDIYKKLGCDPSKDVLKIDGFDEGQMNVVKAVIKKMRVCEAYNGRKKLLLSDRRYYNWYVKNSSGSGLVFDGSSYHGDGADASSAARLSFSKLEHLEDARKKFPELDLDIIDLK